MAKNKNRQREAKTTGAPKAKATKGPVSTSTTPPPARRHLKTGNAGSRPATGTQVKMTKYMGPNFKMRMMPAEDVPRKGANGR